VTERCLTHRSLVRYRQPAGLEEVVVERCTDCSMVVREARPIRPGEEKLPFDPWLSDPRQVRLPW
jgi:hypothetical protein